MVFLLLRLSLKIVSNSFSFNLNEALLGFKFVEERIISSSFLSQKRKSRIQCAFVISKACSIGRLRIFYIVNSAMTALLEVNLFCSWVPLQFKKTFKTSCHQVVFSHLSHWDSVFIIKICIFSLETLLIGLLLFSNGFSHSCVTTVSRTTKVYIRPLLILNLHSIEFKNKTLIFVHAVDFIDSCINFRRQG